MQRTIIAVQNLKWADYDQTKIDMEVNFQELDEGFVPFTAAPTDDFSHTVTLYNNAVNGDYGPIAAYTPPANITGDEAMAMLRAERNQALADTDYIEMPTKWATLTADQQSAWSTYRNALRDLPADYPNASYVYDAQGNGSWSNVTWPTQP